VLPLMVWTGLPVVLSSRVKERLPEKLEAEAPRPVPPPARRLRSRRAGDAVGTNQEIAAGVQIQHLDATGPQGQARRRRNRDLLAADGQGERAVEFQPADRKRRSGLDAPVRPGWQVHRDIVDHRNRGAAGVEFQREAGRGAEAEAQRGIRAASGGQGHGQLGGQPAAADLQGAKHVEQQDPHPARAQVEHRHRRNRDKLAADGQGEVPVQGQTGGLQGAIDGDPRVGPGGEVDGGGPDHRERSAVPVLSSRVKLPLKLEAEIGRHGGGEGEAEFSGQSVGTDADRAAAIEGEDGGRAGCEREIQLGVDAHPIVADFQAEAPVERDKVRTWSVPSTSTRA
jgi:hypothetical protein